MRQFAYAKFRFRCELSTTGVAHSKLRNRNLNFVGEASLIAINETG